MIQSHSRPARSGQTSTSTGQSLVASTTKTSSTHNRSPVRSQPTSTQRLRTPIGVTATVHGQRRSSFANVGDISSDFSTSLGIPYAFSLPGANNQNNGSPSNVSCSSLNNNLGTLPSSSSLASASSNSTISTRAPILRTILPQSPKGSAFHLDFSESSGRRPSTEEVFDLMEREQDAIVLKLMREITQLKEENRHLLSTINSMQSSNIFASVTGSKGLSNRTSFDSHYKVDSSSSSNMSLIGSGSTQYTSAHSSNYTHNGSSSRSISGLVCPLEKPSRPHRHHHHRRHSSVNDRESKIPRTTNTFVSKEDDVPTLDVSLMKLDNVSNINKKSATNITVNHYE